MAWITNESPNSSRWDYISRFQQSEYVERLYGEFHTNAKIDTNKTKSLTLVETKALTRQWLEENNEIRPHGSLGGLSPLQYLRNFRSDKSIINKMKLPDNLILEVDESICAGQQHYRRH